MNTIKFGTDGWRASIADDYTFENVRYCAQGTAENLIAQGLGGQGMVVGYDMRFRSEDFARTVAEVLAGNGVRAYMAKVAAPTPVLSFSITTLKAGGGVWITASHNPATDNGFKLRSSYAGAAAPEVLVDVEARIAASQARGEVKRLPYDQALRQGLVQEFDATEPYLEQIHRLIDVTPLRTAGLDIVVDPMWGVGQGWFPQLLAGDQTKIIEIHAERNPLFPGMKRPEPIDENLQGLFAAIRQHKAAAGLATDGDADRVGFASEKGVFVNQLQVYALLAFYLLEVRGERGPLVKTLSTTVMANKLGKVYGVDVYETLVGFKFVAPEMLRVNALMGGEESGGFAFRGHIPERDGILAGLYLLDLMVKMNKTPSQLIEHLFSIVGPHYYDRVDRPLAPGAKEQIYAQVKVSQPTHLAGLKVLGIDTEGGFRYRLEHGDWVLIRFSGTEDVIRVYCETTHQDKIVPLLDAGLQLAGLAIEG
ncbi:MAG: phosphoglucomutase/phosphomannomutase family protein [Anaerolineae bacterium]